MKLETKIKRKVRKRVKALITTAISAILLVGINFIDELLPHENKTVTLKKCTDGDTAHFMIDGKNRTVRFLAIDTPETVHPDKKAEPFGKEASNYTCRALEEAQTIEIEFEPDNKVDKYDRYLAWIFVDGELLQEKLVSEGLAKVAYLYDDYRYTDRLLDAQEIAQKNKKGIWKN